jgi:1-acyl-sn-glycerol-3-phosphate acyltransferase
LIERDVSSVGVFPEGTRTENDVILGEFHEGIFNIAYRAKCPVVVVTFKNTEMIHKNFPLHSTKVDMHILRTIPYEEFRDKNAKQLSDEVHEMMLKELSK